MEEKDKQKPLNIYQKLSNIQVELKAPKGQKNTFGNYKYRSCEDILEAVKPLCSKEKTVLLLSDSIQHIEGRFYVCATATLNDCESDDAIEVCAYAREALSKKGMDDSQVTGATSSYARKYALNGLFNIDDTKDADTDEMHKAVDNGKKEEKANSDQIERIRSYVESHPFIKKEGIAFMKNVGKKKIELLSKVEADYLLDYFATDEFAEKLSNATRN